eukprot:TRINITY_DN3921_c3_g1_i2.p1 TRINITY_DN3921_c3_g1~~TRINITY_DN3921_c3_g1_i2.p1  ORF type:complete len:470 (+),score=100.76 TRINITY_DN3921_c3_g1_i2:55-1464(+)
MSKSKSKKKRDNEATQMPIASDRMELQMYPRYATVDNYKTVPRCVHPRQWVKDADIDMCKRCKEEFTFTVRKHHCRVCGQIYCQNCSNKALSLPKEDDIAYDVRVCLGCYADYQQPVVKNYKERSLGSTVSMKGSSFSLLTEQHFYSILSYLTIHQTLSTIGSSCRNFYFICREDPLWAALGYALPVSSEIPRFSSVCSSTPGSPMSEGQDYPSPASGGSVEKYPIGISGALLVHPMSLYHKYCQRLASDRKKRFKLLHKRLQEIIMNPVKVGIVGPPTVGKSSLVNNFVFGKWDQEGHMGETAGGRVRSKKYTASPIVKCCRYNVQEVTQGTLDIVDCSGSVRYTSLMPTYLSGVQVLVVCVQGSGVEQDVLLNSITELVDENTPHCLTDTQIIVCFLSPPPPELNVHAAHPRITAVTSADPYSGIGVKDVFRMAIQLLIDRDVVHIDPLARPPEKKPSPTPLDILLK